MILRQKKKVEKKKNSNSAEVETKLALQQRFKKNIYIKKIKELNKSNVYCKGIGAFYIVNRNVFSFSCG